ncbi:MAG: RNA polymerase sigma factor [Tepidisphaerales bacterium]
MSDLPDGAFPTTNWSQIALAGHDDTGVRREALRGLLCRYLRPMQIHLRLRQKLDADAAEEVVQAFLVSKVLEQQFFAKADRGKGRFRTFLLTALDRFASNAARNDRGRQRASLDEVPEPADPAPGADDGFDAAWAREVIRHALGRMRDECERHGRQDVWSVFEGRLIAPALDDAQPVPYAQLVDRLQLGSPAEGFNLLATAKRTFARALRSVVGEYEMGQAGIEEEIAALQAALARSHA